MFLHLTCVYDELIDSSLPSCLPACYTCLFDSLSLIALHVAYLLALVFVYMPSCSTACFIVSMSFDFTPRIKLIIDTNIIIRISLLMLCLLTLQTLASSY